MSKEIAKLDQLIKKKKKELEDLDKMLLNGRAEEKEDPEVLVKIKHFEKQLEKYKNYLISECGESEEAPSAQTEQYLAKLDKVYQRKKAQLPKYEEEIALLEEQYKKCRNRVKKRKQYNIEIEDQQNKIDRKYKRAVEKFNQTNDSINELRKLLKNNKAFKDNKDLLKIFGAFDIKAELNNIMNQQKSISIKTTQNLQKEIENRRKLLNCEDNKEQLQEEIERLKKEIEQSKELMNKKKTHKKSAQNKAEEEKKKKEKIQQIRQNKEQTLNNYSAALSQWSKKFSKEFNLSINSKEIEFNERFEKFTTTVKKTESKIVNVNNNREAFAVRERAPAVVEKKDIKIQYEQPGIKDYVEKRKKVLTFCSDSAEIKYFLYSTDRLIKEYLAKKKQRDNSRKRYNDTKNEKSLEFSNRRTISLTNINRKRTQQKLPPIELPPEYN